MNYIAELNAFHDYLLANRLSTSEIALWHALMHINNSTMWKTEFTASNLILQQITGLSRSSLADAKNKLKQRGLIEYIPGKPRQAGMFKMLSICHILDELPDELPDEFRTSSRTSSGRVAGTLININKNINKNKKEVEVEEARAPGIPYQKIINLYNRLCPKMNRCMKASDAREKAIKARYSSGYGLEDFEKLFKMAGESRFLNGGNDRNWRADFDWLVRDSNMAKVLEGKYADKEEQKYDGDWYD